MNLPRFFRQLIRHFVVEVKNKTITDPKNNFISVWKNVIYKKNYFVRPDIKMYEVSKFYQIQFPPAAIAVGAEFAVDVYSNSRHAKSTKFEISSRNKSKLKIWIIYITVQFSYIVLKSLEHRLRCVLRLVDLEKTFFT